MILIFLRNLTSTVIISVAIPLSMLVTFIVFYFTGQTLNVFTLGGLALGIGRLVDDSIVELENIQRHLNTNSSRWNSILDAAPEVAMPIFASTVATVVVFLPMFFVVGIARLLLIPLTVTIAIVLFTSFLVSRTVTPALCYKFLKPEQETWRSMPSWFTKLMEWSRRRYESLDRSYEDSLQWVLGHRRIFLALVLLLFVGSLTLVPPIGTEFLPVSDESQFRIVLRAPVGQRVEKTEQQVSEVERVLQANIPATELETIVSNSGILSQGRSSTPTRDPIRLRFKRTWFHRTSGTALRPRS